MTDPGCGMTTVKRYAWAIATGTASRFIGHGWFDQAERLFPWHAGLRIALFSTRAVARVMLRRVKGPADQGRFPLAKVVRVAVRITEEKPDG